MRNELRYLFLTGIFLSLVSVRHARADSASDDLTKIETETLVLKAREKQLEVQAGILAKQADILAKQVEAGRLISGGAMGDPTIRSIEGLGSALYATLQLDNGNIVEVTTGDTLSNGMKIVSIRPNEVIVQTAKKQRIRLAAAVQAPAIQPAVVYRGAVPGYLPPLPPPIPKGAAK